MRGHGRLTTRMPEVARPIRSRCADLSKSDWIDLYFDLYRQVLGESSTDEEIITDAERRDKILENYHKAESA